MTEPEDNVAYYDAFSLRYEDRRGSGYHRFLDDEQAGLVRRHLRPGDRVLEVGCGTGLIMQRLPGADLRGVDLSPGMLERARARGLRVQEASALDLPFALGTFDLVYSFKVLAHVEEISQAVRECHRVLKPGGLAILDFYNPWSLRGLRKRFSRGRISDSLREDQVLTRFDGLRRARGLLVDAGFRYVGHRGIIIVTPAALLHQVPFLGSPLRFAERLSSATPLGRLGGFLSVLGRKS